MNNAGSQCYYKYLFHLSILFIILVMFPYNKCHAAGGTYYYDVTSYRANGFDHKDDTAAIQEALDHASSDYHIVVTVPEGTYYISKTLYIQSNTTLKLSKNAIIKRSRKALGKNMLRNTNAGHESSSGEKYNLSHNITVTGGVWDGGRISKAKSTSNLLYFGHARNITIKNTAIRNCFGAHTIEFAGVKDSRIKNCKISGFRYSSSKFTSEAIQLDICYKNKEDGRWTPGFYSDKTPCKNISIENCTISDYPRGIGIHHTLKGHNCSDITIRNNKFRRSLASTQGKSVVGVYLMGVRKVKMTNNIFDHYSYGAMVKTSSDLTIKKNVFSYNNSGALIVESCDEKNARRTFSIVTDKKDDKDETQTDEDTKQDLKKLEFTCPYIYSGSVKINGKTYRYHSDKTKKLLKMEPGAKRGTLVRFYGKDRWDNKYYQMKHIPDR